MKKIIKIFGVVMFVAITGYHIYVSQKSEDLSGLLLTNVEALAGFENGKYYWDCWLGLDDTSSPNFIVYTECRDCSSSSAVYLCCSNTCAFW